LFEGKIKSWEWAVERMKSLHVQKVTFGANTMEIIKVLHKPKDCPSLIKSCNKKSFMRRREE
jgi:hypothetical protein